MGTYSFSHDAAGRTHQLTRGTTREEFDFDLGGRMFGRTEWSGNILVHEDVSTFDASTGELARVDALRETVLQTRRGLGALAWVDSYNGHAGRGVLRHRPTDEPAHLADGDMVDHPGHAQPGVQRESRSRL
jgi:hypothetical protein